LRFLNNSWLVHTNKNLVNNAGIGHYVGTLDTTKEQLEETFAVNVFGTVYVTKAVVPHMPAGGRIINITSIASKMGLDIMAAYGASKAALDSLTYSWALEVSTFREPSTRQYS